MKKVANQTARVFWHLGQALLPDHFYTQEQALREELHLRARLLRGPYWGVGEMRWDAFQLPRGIVALQELSLVLPSGTLLDIPGNAAPVHLNLNPSGSQASVYLHLVGDAPDRGVGRGGGEEGVQRIVSRLELSTSNFVEAGSQPPFHLADFECGPDKTWSLRPSYIPPLLQVQADSPFFDPILRRIDTLTAALHQLLLTEAQQDHLAASSGASGRLALHGLFHLQALVVDLRAGVAPHPYELFQALRGFYIDLCVHQGVVPGRVTEAPYQHDELARCFEAILERLEEQAQVNHKHIPYKEFERRDGLLVCDLGRDVRRAKDVYFLVQKPQASSRVDLGRIKLASQSRIDLVYERSLKGVPFTRLESTPFQHGLSSAVEFYTLGPGFEWDHAVREAKLVLYDSPQLTGMRFYLYWRLDG